MKLYKMTQEDVDVLAGSMTDPNVFFEHFFRKKGADRAFQLDYNFSDDAKWQKDFCMAAESLLMVIAGVSTGKTLAVGMSACYHMVVNRSFKFLNIANEGYQADIMYNNIIEMAADTLFEKLIISKPKRPYAKIQIGYELDGVARYSELIFRSTGEKGDASNVMSTRFDWINIEEAGLISGLGDIVKNLVTRLTGSTAEGRPYMGRMSLIANPNDNSELWSIWDMAVDDSDARVWTVNTEDNKNTTKEQIKFALKLIGADDEDAYMTGKRPQGKGKYFSHQSVSRCESDVLDAVFKKFLRERPDGFIAEYTKSLSYWHFELPFDANRHYMVFGDPGTGKAPKRNAPAIMIFDVTDAPKLSTLAGLWWGDGGGDIEPFIDKLIYFIEKYKPLAAAIDATGTQRYMETMINHHYIDGRGYSIPKVDGVDFSGNKKYSFLVSLRQSMILSSIQWQPSIESIGQQLRRYDPVLDKSIKSKLPQDLVSVLLVAAHVIRYYFSVFNNSDSEKDDNERNAFASVLRSSFRDVRLSAGRQGSQSSIQRLR